MASSRRPASAASGSSMAVTAEEGLALRVLRFLAPEEKMNYFLLIAESGRLAGYPDPDSLSGLGRAVGLLVVTLGTW